MSKKRRRSKKSLANLNKGQYGPDGSLRLRSSDEQAAPVVPEIPVGVKKSRTTNLDGHTVTDIVSRYVTKIRKRFVFMMCTLVPVVVHMLNTNRM